MSGTVLSKYYSNKWEMVYVGCLKIIYSVFHADEGTCHPVFMFCLTVVGQKWGIVAQR